MLTVGNEREHLDEADRHIAEARRRIAGQVRLTRRQGRTAEAAALSIALLQTMRDTLALMVEHRQMIVAELDRLQSPDKKKPQA